MKYYLRTFIAIILLTTLGCKKSNSIHFIKVCSYESDNYILIIPDLALYKKPSAELDINIVEELKNVNKIFVSDDGFKLSPLDLFELKKKTLLLGHNNRRLLLEYAISNENYELLSNLLSQQGSDMLMFKTYQPWAIAMIYIPELFFKNELYFSNNIIDLIHDKVGEDKIIPLRKREETYDYFSDMPLKEQEMLLQLVLEYFPGHSNNYYNDSIEFIKSIENGDFGEAEKEVNTSIDNVDYEIDLLTKYTEQSIQSFISYTEKEFNAGFNSMIICNPTQIFGDPGILEYFRKKGFEVKYY